jgi:hypothetical protein
MMFADLGYLTVCKESADLQSAQSLYVMILLTAIIIYDECKYQLLRQALAALAKIDS